MKTEEQPAAESEQDSVITHPAPPNQGEPQSVRDAWDRLNGWSR